MRELHVSRAARERYELSGALFGLRGAVIVADVAGARRLAARMNEARAAGTAPGTPTITGGELYALGILHEISHRLVGHYEEAVRAGAIAAAARDL
ncbi:MAG TPA: hypothetical protein VGC90_07790, partial [Candidatus Limnocylindrales bacterium]